MSWLTTSINSQIKISQVSKYMFNSEIKVDRILLIFGMLIYPFWGFVFLILNPDFYDPYSHRFIISGYIFLIFIGTFVLKVNRKILDIFLFSIIYIVTFKQVQLIHRNDLSLEYFIGYIIIVVSLISYFKTVKQILSYSLFSVLLILLIFVVEKEPHLNKFIFYIASIFTITFFLSVIYFTKIANQNKLIDFSVKLSENEEKYRILLESVPDAIITVNQAGEIINANKRASELFEYEAMELECMKIEQLIPERYKKVHEKNRIDYKKMPKAREMGSGKKLFGISKSGREIPVEISLSPVMDNKHEFKVIALIRDISQKIETENEMAQIRKELHEKEITEKLSRAKSEFISKMSHEIRTPLNGIYGFTNVLLKEKLNSEQLKYLESIKFSSDILKTLIDDILDNTNIEAGKISLSFDDELNIRELFEHVIQNFDYQVKNKQLILQLGFELDPLPADRFLIGDRLRISQIVMNLLSNAIKFSDEKKEISVQVHLQNINENLSNLEFTISNCGLKIPADKIEEIFEPYAQISSSITQKFGGTGLGLSIVKNLVNLMGGSISVVSDEKTLFTVRIPLKQSEKNPASKKDDNKGFMLNSETKKIKILVAEDNKLNQLLIQTILSKNGFTFTIVENGLEVLEEMKKDKYGLVLMDIQMPEMDGIECATLLRKQKEFKIPIIALTADVKKNSSSETENLFNGFVKKPFDEDELLHQIYKVCSSV